MEVVEEVYKFGLDRALVAMNEIIQSYHGWQQGLFSIKELSEPAFSVWGLRIWLFVGCL